MPFKFSIVSVGFCLTVFLAPPSLLAGAFDPNIHDPSFQEVLLHFQNAWDYTDPIGNLYSKEASEQHRRIVQNILFEFHLPPPNDQSKLQRRAFMRAYNYHSEAFFAAQDAYLSALRQIIDLNASEHESIEGKELLRKLEYNFQVSSIYHSSLAQILVNAGESILTSNRQKLLAFDALFDFHDQTQVLNQVNQNSKLMQLLNATVAEKVSETVYNSLLLAPGIFEKPILNEIKQVLGHAASILGAIHVSSAWPARESQYPAVSDRADRLVNTLSDYWTAFTDMTDRKSALDRLEKLQIESCSWVLIN